MRRLAAAVMTLALASAACGTNLETPAETLRSEDVAESTFGYVLDELPAGYELCAVTTPSALSLEPEVGASLHVYGDGSIEDPYAGPLYGVALFQGGPLADLELGDTTEVAVGEETARVGRADGLLLAELPADAGRVLTFGGDDGAIVQVVVRGDDTADLVALAESVRIDGESATLDGRGLPDGFVDLGDLYRLEGRPQFRFALDHQLGAAGDGSVQDQMTLLGAEGDISSLEAFRFRAATSRRVQVAGADGVVADIGATGSGPYVVSWMADDGLILRLFSFGIEPDALVALAATARRIDGDEWAELRSVYEPSSCER